MLNYKEAIFFAATSLTLQLLIAYQINAEFKCGSFLNTTLKGSPEKCEKLPRSDMFQNLPQLGGVFCYNNGSGICKAFAGRFEFFFNTFTDTVIGPAEKSKFVDEFGYHERVPVSYTISGNILYVDRAINWADDFRKEQDKPINLMSTRDFNWCGYTDQDWWPYKSSVIDAKSKGKFNVYFFNRQSCIVNTETKTRQHFNTRFLHNSSLRIDLDMNPLIFAMEDHLAKEVRLVKNKRQHWYEVPYEVIEWPTPNISYFVSMSASQVEPCKINGTNGPILSKRAYTKFTNICLSDMYHNNRRGKDSSLLMPHCGFDSIEIADLNYPQFKLDQGLVIEADLHNLPRQPPTSENFYGIKILDQSDWETFAKDGLTFSATTTIPIGNATDKVRVIMLYADFKKVGPADKYDEYFPTPLLAEYIANYKKTSNGNDWTFDRKSKEQIVKNLNYVDDIAYLHRCQTILVIFGPLYTEFPHDKFSLQTKAPVDSISKLSVWELVNAFFAVPESNIIYFYHRMNYVTDHIYTCGKSKNELVTAKKGSGKYFPRWGLNQPSVFGLVEPANDIDIFEETFFQKLNVFKGSIGSPNAPNPAKYIGARLGPAEPVEAAENLLLYIFVAIGVIVIMVMCVICLVTFRRRRRRRLQEAASAMGPISTARSSMVSNGASRASARSGLTEVPSDNKMARHPTSRSVMTQASRSRSGKRTPITSASTVRSTHHGARGSSTSNRSGPMFSAGTNRSKLHSRSTEPTSRSSIPSKGSMSGHRSNSNPSKKKK